MPVHRMRGTVLLLASNMPVLVNVNLLRANQLTVYHFQEPDQALQQFEDIAPDIVVAVLTAPDSASIVPALRDLADPATSIIVVAGAAEREAVRNAGADAFLLDSARPEDLLYQIHRALILRRSGRRLPWTS